MNIIERYSIYEINLRTIVPNHYLVYTLKNLLKYLLFIITVITKNEPIYRLVVSIMIVFPSQALILDLVRAYNSSVHKSGLS